MRTWLPPLAGCMVLAFVVVCAPGFDGPAEQSSPAEASPDSIAAPTQFSLDDPASPWVLVTKSRPLAPADYAPTDLVQPNIRLAVNGEVLLNSTTASAAEAMFTTAAADGVTITLASGYRSHLTQAATFEGHVAALGQEGADTASARPGHSEHQTGWAFDIGDDGTCNFQPCFAGRPAAQWAAANAHRFGFIVRYPAGSQVITGYAYEPWHLRYIGAEAAADMAARGITLEEYLDLTAEG